jgi:hypothetical protein
MKLYRTCGRFTRVAGSDRILHVVKLWPHLVSGEIELWETVAIRALRYALMDGVVTGATVEQSSLSLYLGALAWRTRPTVIVEPFCRFGAELEAIKLAGMSATEQIAFKGLFIEPDIATLFEHLHQRIDREASPVSIAAPCVVASAEEAIASVPRDALVLINSSKRGNEILPLLWRALASSTWDHTAQIVIACRVGEGQGVTDIDGRSFTLPVADDILSHLSAAGWHPAWRYVENFDRDYFLPFDGAAGLAVIHARRQPGSPIDVTLSPYRAAVSGAIVPFTGKEVARYDQGFDWPLPELSQSSEPDWRALAQSMDWNPETVDWNLPDATGSADPLIIGHSIASEAPGWPGALARQNGLLSAWQSDNAFTPEGYAIVAAALLKSGDPAHAVALDRALAACPTEPRKAAVQALFTEWTG